MMLTMFLYNVNYVFLGQINISWFLIPDSSILGRIPFMRMSTTLRMCSVSSVLVTRPNHYNLLLLVTITTRINPCLLQCKISSFLRCSNCNRLTPHCTENHHCHLCCCHTLFIFNCHWPMFRSRKATSVESLFFCIKSFIFVGTFFIANHSSQISPL